MQFLYVDTDKHPGIAQPYGVMGLPTMLLFKKGKVANQLVGFRPEPQVRAFVGS